MNSIQEFLSTPEKTSAFIHRIGDTYRLDIETKGETNAYWVGRKQGSETVQTANSFIVEIPKEMAMAIKAMFGLHTDIINVQRDKDGKLTHWTMRWLDGVKTTPQTIEAQEWADWKDYQDLQETLHDASYRGQ